MKKFSTLCSSVALLAMAGISTGASAAGLEGTAYVIDGGDNNRVIVFGRFSNGSLRNFGSVSTGGGGFGRNADFDPTGGQDSLVMSEDGRYLYATNPGSGEISVFFLTNFGRPVLIQKVSSGGIFPTSIAIDGDVLYVINGGGDGALVPFNRGEDGRLSMIEGHTQTFDFGFGGIPEGFTRNLAPGDIAFDTTKRHLMMVYAGGGEILDVSGFANLPRAIIDFVGGMAPTGQIYTWNLDNDGLVVGEPEIRDAEGVLPFAIEFTENGYGLVAAAVTGSLTSYDFTGVGAELETVFGRVETGIFESCWVEITSSRYAYVTNPFEGTLSSFRVERDGSIALVEQAAAAPGLPTDMAIDSDESHLYVVVVPTGEVQSFEIDHDTGALTFAGAGGGLPIFANDGHAPHGLVVR